MKFKRWSWCMIFVALCLLVVPSNRLNAQQQTSNLTYENHGYGIKMQYPSNWKEVDHLLGSVVAFGLVPGEGESVFVQVWDLVASSSSVEKFTPLVIQQFKKGSPTMKIEESNKSTLAGLPSHTIVSTEQTKSLCQ